MRLILPAWLGIGEALEKAIEAEGLDTLQEMYREWPFFQSTMSLVEMVLAKADSGIARCYLRALVSEELQPLGEDLLERLRRTEGYLLEVSSSRGLLENNPALLRSIEVRTPYVDPIYLTQIEILRRIHERGEVDEDLAFALNLIFSGVAAGMRNTG